MPQETVLLVDDEVHIRRIAELSLARVGGMQVRCAASGAEALEALATFSPDLIVLDVMMPAMDGPTLLARIRENTLLADVPVIFMTAKAEPDEVARLRSLGAIAVITKPFEPMTLATEIRRLVVAQRDTA